MGEEIKLANKIALDKRKEARVFSSLKIFGILYF